MTKCWCSEVREHENEGIKLNGNVGESDFMCWQCRDEKDRSNMLSTGDYKALALFDGVSDFDEFKRIMDNL